MYRERRFTLLISLGLHLSIGTIVFIKRATRACSQRLQQGSREYSLGIEEWSFSQPHDQSTLLPLYLLDTRRHFLRTLAKPLREGPHEGPPRIGALHAFGAAEVVRDEAGEIDAHLPDPMI